MIVIIKFKEKEKEREIAENVLRAATRLMPNLMVKLTSRDGVSEYFLNTDPRIFRRRKGDRA